jgi:predicted membrane protein
VTAFFGDVVLDLREAILQSQRVTIYATAIAGQIKLIVPAGIAVEMAGRSVLGVRSVRGQARSSAQTPASGVIEVRTLTFGGSVKATTARRPRWRPGQRRR